MYTREALLLRVVVSFDAATCSGVPDRDCSPLSYTSFYRLCGRFSRVSRNASESTQDSKQTSICGGTRIVRLAAYYKISLLKTSRDPRHSLPLGRILNFEFRDDSDILFNTYRLFQNSRGDRQSYRLECVRNVCRYNI